MDTKEPRDAVAKNAETARIQAGFKTHEAASKKIGCSRTLVLAWENGKAKLEGSKYLLDAARVYKVRPEWLAKNEGPNGYPWSPNANRIADNIAEYITGDSLDMRTRALDTVLTGFARAMAETIPTLGRALEAELARFPQDLQHQNLVSVLLQVVRQQNAQNDLLAPDTKAKKRSRS